MPKVYSPAGVTCWLCHAACWAVAGDSSIPAAASLQRSEAVLLDVVSVRISALAVPIEIGRTIATAETRYFFGCLSSNICPGLRRIRVRRDAGEIGKTPEATPRSGPAGGEKSGWRRSGLLAHGREQVSAAPDGAD